MIETKNLTMIYKEGTKPALSDASLQFEDGKIYGLLGRNGAGKSTLLNLITNRIFPTEGAVFVDGVNASENDHAQGKIFCMTEKSSYPADMRAARGFYWAKHFYPNFDMPYALELSAKFGLDTKKRVSALSTGYSSIYKLILSLASGAQHIIFDEPVLGLDAAMRELFYRTLIERFSQTEPTVIIATHLIEEVANILERVIIIDQGKILVDDDLDSVRMRAYAVTGPVAAVSKFSDGKKILGQENLGGYSAVTIDGKLSKDERAYAAQLGLQTSPASLQDIFVKLTSQGGK